VEAVPTWKWLLGIALFLLSAFSSGTEAALASLGEARARQLREAGGRAARAFGLWIDFPDRVLATLLLVGTAAKVGAGALASVVASDLVASMPAWNPAFVFAAALAATAAVLLFFGVLVPRKIGRWHPVRVGAVTMPLAWAAAILLWPLASAFARGSRWFAGHFGAGRKGAPAMTSEELEYLIERGTRDGVIDEVREELLSSVLEFADRVAREIMIPRTRMVAIDKDAAPETLLRVLTENPYSRMPVYEGSVDNVIGFLLVRDFVQELRHGALRPAALERYLKPAFFVPEAMKISRLLKEMQRRKTHLAVVVDEFGGTSGLVTLEDVLEEIVGEIQDEGDAEAAPVKAIGPGRWLADASVPLHDLEDVLNAPEEAGAGEALDPGSDDWNEVRFPETGDYETLGGLVTATAGRVPAVGAEIAWEGLTFTVRAGDERRVTKIEISRRLGAGEEADTEPKAVAR
jgi:putative hemolysin